MIVCLVICVLHRPCVLVILIYEVKIMLDTGICAVTSAVYIS